VEHGSASKDVSDRLDAFTEILLRWTATVNLIAPGDVASVRTRHIEDCLQLVPLVPPGVPRGIDLGSGAGFPGLVLAIATGVPFDLIEADHRKAAFLREAARLTAAPATIHARRIEDISLPPAPLVTARALARLPRLLALAVPKLAPDGVCLFLKGAGAPAELTAAAADWHMRVETIPSRTDPSATILRISEIARVARE
jgi:16S rRNA (guanine527-N7)-methyltransferase